MYMCLLIQTSIVLEVLEGTTDERTGRRPNRQTDSSTDGRRTVPHLFIENCREIKSKCLLQ